MAAGASRDRIDLRAGLAVSDASPIIALHQVNRLALLRLLFRDVVVPLAVAREVSPSVERLPAWLRVEQPPEVLRFSGPLGPGEREAISLALHLDADFLVIDDRPGRHAATRRGLAVTGTLGLLVRARQRGLIPAVRPEMDALIATGL
jgi:predicted nucleic acid-binding protein